MRVEGGGRGAGGGRAVGSWVPLKVSCMSRRWWRGVGCGGRATVGHGPHKRQVARVGDGNRAVVGTGLVGGELREREMAAEEREVVAQQQWVMGIEGELCQPEMAADGQEVVAEQRQGLGPRWRQVAWAGGSRAVVG
jgi:hypothetical protein